MRRRARITVAFLAAASAPLAALCGPAWAQGALNQLPSFRSVFHQRADAIAVGFERPTFLGAASLAPRNGFPWMASIQIRGVLGSAGHFCGGIAVAPAFILTAAHCVSAGQPSGVAVAVDPGRLQALLRTNVLFQGGDLRTVAEVTLHPDYRVTAKGVPVNDLALLKTAGAPDLAAIRIAEPAEAEALLTHGNKLRIFGWGTASFDPGGAISNNLLYAFVEVSGGARCNAPEIYAGAVDDNMFCAGLGFADACQGDSGGPAIGYLDGRVVLVGITSWGAGCIERNYPGVYVHVAKYRDWIRRTVGAQT